MATRSRKTSRSEPVPVPAAPRSAVSAVEMGARQREISVSEFFTKNRHLLGFDNPRKALLTSVKEAVDNSLDACEEAGILPGHRRQGGGVGNGGPAPPASQASRFRITRARQRPRHRPAADPADLRQAALRLEVPPPADEPRAAGHRHLGRRHVRPADDRQAREDHLAHEPRKRRRTIFEMQIDTKKNEPQILEKKQIEWDSPRGTQVTHRGRGSLPEGPRLGRRVRRADVIANPHVKLTYFTPGGRDQGASRGRTTGAGVAARDQAASLRHRARHAAQDAAGHEEPLALRIPGRGLLPGVAASGRGHLQGRRSLAARASAGRPRAGRGESLQGDPVDEDHGAADQLPVARSASARSSRASTSRSKATSTRRSAGRRLSIAAIPS